MDPKCMFFCSATDGIYKSHIMMKQAAFPSIITPFAALTTSLPAMISLMSTLSNTTVV